MTQTDTAMTVEDSAAVAIAAVHLKLPPFWPADPNVWFAQVEAQFNTRGITAQKTKYDYVVASLLPEFTTKVRNLILNVPDNPYDTLKQQLIQRTCLPEQRRLQQLFNSTELGDRKPTQLLRRMQQLLGDSAQQQMALFFVNSSCNACLPTCAWSSHPPWKPRV
jgi:hypothetical protein